MHLKCLYGRETETEENDLKEGLLINNDIKEKEENIENIHFAVGANLNIQFPETNDKIIRTNANSTIKIIKQNCASGHTEYKMMSKSARFLGYGFILTFGLVSTLMKIISFF